MARPSKYNTSEELENKVNEYFDWCDSQEKVITFDKGMKIIYKPYTISGLCLHLGICRDTLCEYEKKEKFSDTIKKAKQRVENWIEEHSLSGDINPTVSIFNLKNNFGWKDKTEVDNKTDGTLSIKWANEM